MKQLREKANLTRVDVAHYLKVAESTVRNWEVGRTEPTLSVPKTIELCRLYGVTLEELGQAVENSRPNTP